MVICGLVVERGHDVRIVDIVGFALDGVGGDAVIAHQRGGDIVLRGQRIRSAQHDVGAAVAQGDHQVRGFGGHVQARGHADPGQRLGLDELFADGLQHRHGLGGPLGAALSQIGQRKIFYVTGYGFSG